MRAVLISRMFRSFSGPSNCSKTQEGARTNTTSAQARTDHQRHSKQSRQAASRTSHLEARALNHTPHPPHGRDHAHGHGHGHDSRRGSKPPGEHPPRDHSEHRKTGNEGTAANSGLAWELLRHWLEMPMPQLMERRYGYSRYSSLEARGPRTPPSHIRSRCRSLLHLPSLRARPSGRCPKPKPGS